MKNPALIPGPEPSADTEFRRGEVACPFNSLYWGFLDRHFDRFRRNHRIAVILRNLSHMDVDHLTRVRERTRELTKTFQG